MADDLDLAPIRADFSPALAEEGSSGGTAGGEGIPTPVLVGGVALVALLVVLVAMETSSTGAENAGADDEGEAADEADGDESAESSPWDTGDSHGGLIEG